MELELADRYAYQVVNDDLGVASGELHKILESLPSSGV